MSNINLKLVDSKNIYGTINGGSVRLSNITDADKRLLRDIHGLITTKDLEDFELTAQDKDLIFKKHRQAFAKAEGFDWKKMFMADQKNGNGSYFELTAEYVEANPKGWTDIDEDILVITDKVPGIVAGMPVADCPVIMLEDKKQGITAVGHCSAALIDKKLPGLMVEALQSGYDSKIEDLTAHVGASAGPEWTYDRWPAFATDQEIWKEAILPREVRDENGVSTVFKLNIKKPIFDQLTGKDMSQEQILFDMTDTITSPEYYSNAVCKAQPGKFGRQFVGAVYQKTEGGRTR